MRSPISLTTCVPSGRLRSIAAAGSATRVPFSAVTAWICGRLCGRLRGLVVDRRRRRRFGRNCRRRLCGCARGSRQRALPAFPWRCRGRALHFPAEAPRRIGQELRLPPAAERLPLAVGHHRQAPARRGRFQVQAPSPAPPRAAQARCGLVASGAVRRGRLRLRLGRGLCLRLRLRCGLCLRLRLGRGLCLRLRLRRGLRLRLRLGRGLRLRLRLGRGLCLRLRLRRGLRLRLRLRRRLRLRLRLGRGLCLRLRLRRGLRLRLRFGRGLRLRLRFGSRLRLRRRLGGRGLLGRRLLLLLFQQFFVSGCRVGLGEDQFPDGQTISHVGLRQGALDRPGGGRRSEQGAERRSRQKLCVAFHFVSPVNLSRSLREFPAARFVPALPALRPLPGKGRAFSWRSRDWRRKCLTRRAEAIKPSPWMRRSGKPSRSRR